MTLVSAFRVDDLDVRVFPSERELGEAAAADAASAIRSAVERRGRANAMFATGNSQFAFLDALTARDDVPWEHVTGFHMDEYVGMFSGAVVAEDDVEGRAGASATDVLDDGLFVTT